jgi:hypothetical protein
VSQWTDEERVAFQREAKAERMAAMYQRQRAPIPLNTRCPWEEAQWAAVSHGTSGRPWLDPAVVIKLESGIY